MALFDQNSFDDGSMAKALGTGAAAAGFPWLSAASALAPMAGQALGGKSGSVGPSRADSGARSESNTEAIFNNSGWVVNFGDDAQVSPSISAGTSKLPGLGEVNPVVLLVIAGAVLLLWKRSK